MNPRFSMNIETQGDHPLLLLQINHFLPFRMCQSHSDVSSASDYWVLCLLS